MSDERLNSFSNNSVALVREQTTPTERPPFGREVSANFLRIEGSRMVSAADTYGRNLGFLDRKIRNYVFSA
jgi:hypothetical protein